MAMSAESRALQRSNAAFKRGVDPDNLVTVLYSNFLLTREEKAKATQKTLTPEERSEEIFAALERRVSVEPICLKNLIQALKDEPATASLGGKIQGKPTRLFVHRLKFFLSLSVFYDEEIGE